MNSKTTLKPVDLLQLGQAFEFGLKGGRDTATILRWLSQESSSVRVRDFCIRVTTSARVDSLEKALEREKSLSTELLTILFIEILQQSQRGTHHLSQLLENYLKTLRITSKLEKQRKSLLFVPKFQAIVGLIVACLFSFILPTLWPELFPSFLSSGRWELFMLGVCGVLLGVYSLHLMCRRPERHMASMIQSVYFLQFMALMTQGGLDFVSAWTKSLQIIPFPPSLKTAFEPSSSRVLSMADFLDEKRKAAPESWRPLLAGLSWVVSSGQGISGYLKSSSEIWGEEIALQWEDEIRKLSALSVLPLSFLVFPASMFLLVGPHFLELML